MRKILLAAMLLSTSPAIATVTITPLGTGPFVTDHTDLFDVSNGTTFTGGSGGYPTFDERDAFGASTPTSYEPGNYVFNDFIYPYQTQALGFKTATAVTISGFNMYLGSDPNGLRQFDFMSLSGSIDNVTFTLLDSFTLSTATYLSAYGSTSIRVQSTFAAATYQYFRLVAHDRTGFEGGRILELDAIAGNATAGVPEPATWAMLVLGFGAVGAALRGRRRAARVRFA